MLPIRSPRPALVAAWGRFINCYYKYFHREQRVIKLQCKLLYGYIEICSCDMGTIGWLENPDF